MTGLSSLFSSYCVYSGRDKIRIANGFFSSVASTGCIPLSSSQPLSYVFHVPNCKLNPVFVSHITKVLNCNVSFFSSYCVFQDLKMRKTTSRGHGDQGLYLIDCYSPIASTVQKTPSSPIPSDSQHDQLFSSIPILGLSHFPYYKGYLRYYAILFHNFQCETCELAKHCRIFYSPNTSSNITLFSLTHSNVWGPAPVASLFGYRYFVSFVDDYSRNT